MCFSSYFAARRAKATSRRTSKQALNDQQRCNETLLRVALRHHSSTNSLTPRDPAAMFRLRKQKAAEAKLEAEMAQAEGLARDKVGWEERLSVRKFAGSEVNAALGKDD